MWLGWRVDSTLPCMASNDAPSLALSPQNDKWPQNDKPDGGLLQSGAPGPGSGHPGAKAGLARSSLASPCWVRAGFFDLVRAVEHHATARILLNLNRGRKLLIVALAAVLLEPGRRAAADERTRLPQEHAYQQTLREYLGTLNEQDFDHGVSEVLTAAEKPLSAEQQFRLFLMTKMHQPLVGWKRGTPAVNAPPRLLPVVPA